jgi:hypothetical protein
MRPLSDKRTRLPSSTQHWLKSDLLFLRLSVGSGMTIAEVAGFLGRNADEVRKKAVELGQVVSAQEKPSGGREIEPAKVPY